MNLETSRNKASQAIQSPRTVLFFLLISLLDVYSFANVHVKGIVLGLFHVKMWPSGEVAPKFDLPPIELN